MHVGIPRIATEGAFDSEFLVDFDTMDGEISGFASFENVHETEDEALIKAEVISVKSDSLPVRVEGSFFHHAHVSPGQATKMAA